MERKDFLKSKKYYLKGLSKTITALKAEFKELERQNGERGAMRREVRKAKYEFRHQHIAYCLVRKVKGDIYCGKTLTDEAIERYYQIENKVKDGNEATFDYIRHLVDEYPVVQEVHDEPIVRLDS